MEEAFDKLIDNKNNDIYKYINEKINKIYKDKETRRNQKKELKDAYQYFKNIKQKRNNDLNQIIKNNLQNPELLKECLELYEEHECEFDRKVKYNYDIAKQLIYNFFS